jgi:RNA polymerase sigma factor (sigma-70 family)
MKPQDAHPDARLDDSRATRASLLERVKNWGDDESWQDFFNAYWRLIYRLAIRSGLNDAEAEEVVQETMLAIARNIRTFEYDPKKGSFRQWVIQMTQWRIQDYFRRKPMEHPPRYEPRRADADGAGLDETATAHKIPDPNANPVASLENHWALALADVALERLKLRVNPLHYQIYDLHVLKGLTHQQVAKTLRVRRPQVYLVKSRLSRLLKQEIQSLEALSERAPDPCTIPAV